MRRLTVMLIAATLSFTGCGKANETTTAPIASPIIESIGNWEVVPAKSHIQFTAIQQGESFTGGFANFSAVINFEGTRLDQANVKAVIDLGSVSAGNKDRDGALPGKEWFSVKTFPEAVFQSQDFVKTRDGQYEARGMLSLKGQSHPLTLPFTLAINGAVADMRGQVTLDRTLWDIGSGSWASGEWVGTNVTVDIKIHAEKPL